MRSRSLIGIVAAGTLLTACDGLKEALTAHVDVVARSGSQELSVTRLGDLLGNAKIQVPVTRETTGIVADIWTGYQQLAFAAARGDSLNDHKAIDEALAPMFNVQKLQHFMDSVQKTFKADSGTEATYNQAAGGLVGARHILIGYKNPGVPASSAEKDSVRKRADQIRAQVTDANFTELARKYSTDPGVKQNDGNYGVFGAGEMVPQFYNGTLALKPGEISQPIESQYGYHIIQRLPYSAIKKDEYAQRYAATAMRNADSTFMASITDSSNIKVKDDAAATIKNAAKDAPKHQKDKTTLATYKGGSLTVKDALGWIETYPPQAQMLQRIPQAPDSLLTPFIKQLASQQVLLARAEAAKAQVPDSEKTAMYQNVNSLVVNLWGALGIDPKMLADSAKSTAEKERLAASRVDSYLDHMLAGQAQLLSVPAALRKILDVKYETSTNSAGLDRAFERAQKTRASADSARAAAQPKSDVPLPGAGGPPGAPPASQQPQTPPEKP